MKHLEMVWEFHRTFGLPCRDEPTTPPLEECVLRAGLMSEEGLQELARAFGARDAVAVLDALVDLEYIALGAFAIHGMAPRADIETMLEEDCSTPQVPSLGVQINAIAQIAYHVGDYSAACAEHDTDNTRFALTGLLNVLFATYRVAGMWAIRPAAFAEVHASNMSKLDVDGRPIRDERGKVVKGPNYRAPDLASIVAAATPPPVQVVWPLPWEGY